MQQFQGSRLREVREKQGLEQRELAEKMGISRSLLSLYELDMRTPRLEYLVLAAHILGVDVGYFFSDNGRGNGDEIGKLAGTLPKDDREEIKHLIMFKLRRKQEGNFDLAHEPAADLIA